MAELEYIPQGYKKSPLGIIPLEWDVVHLGSLVSITSGESPSSYCLKNFGKYPYVKVEDMNNCEKYQKNSREYSDDERNIVSINSVIFPKRGAAISNNKVRIAACNLQMDSNMMAITPNANTICEFLYYMIKFKQLYRIADTSTIPQINNKHIIPYKICLPPIEEQKKIAQVLSEWDRAIELQTKLIEKQESRKRAFMQRLFTGRVRLNGFSAKWKKTSINSFAEEISIKNKNNEPLIVLSCTKYNGLVPSLEYFGKQVYPDDVTKYKIVQKNHFAYATNHIEEGSIGYQTIENRALISPMYTVFCTNSQIINNIYLYALLKTPHLIYLYKSRIEGSIDRRGGLRWESFSSIKIDLPPLAEQTAIAEVLISVDKEIEIAKTKLSSLRNQKRGLMQQLLTGKKRIK